MTSPASLPAVAPRSRYRSRMGLWLGYASLVHALALGVGWWFRASQPERPLPEPGRRAEVTVDVITLPASEPGEPGGGSLNPDDGQPLAAGVEQPSHETRLAPTVTAPASEQPGPVAPPAELTTNPAEENDAESATDEVAVLDQALADTFLLPTDVNPRAARVSTLAPRLPRDPATGAATHASRGRHLGYGPGAYGGPGGAGRGWRERRGGAGRGAEQAAGATPFGGATGAWVGEICFLPHGTTSLKDVHDCPRAGELRTSVIDVSPRKFDQGFPGVSARFEYFAIKYTGTFLVRETGVYRFRVHADDGAILTIDGQRAIDNDGIHEPLSGWCDVLLPAGEHTFRLTYFQGPRFDIALQVFVRPPEGKEQLFRPVI